jgi:hypothetical protein
MGAQSSEQTGKSPVIAAVLAVLYPGLGHVYLRRWGRALLWFGVIITTIVVLVPESALPTTVSLDALMQAQAALPTHVAGLALVLSIMSVADAYWIAAQTGESGHSEETVPEADTRSCPNCGKEIDEDIDFCHWCTTRLDERDS